MALTKEDLKAKGLTDEQITFVLAEHKTSLDGNYVPKATFDTERETVKTLKADIAARDTQISDLGKFKGTAEDLQTKVTKLEADNKIAADKFNADLAKVQTDSAIRAELVGKVYDPDDVISRIDATKIVVKDGKVVSGLTEILDPLKVAKPHYFIADKTDNGTPPGWLFGKTPPSGADAKDKNPDSAESFGTQLAKDRATSAASAVKAVDNYFK